MLFFATPEDLLAMTDHVEGIEPLDYVLFGHQATPLVVRLRTARDIPGFGIADRDAAVACSKYLVVPRGAHVEPRLIRHVDGPYYAIDQVENDGSICLAGGGRWRDTMLLHGRVDTVGGSLVARKLLRRFESVLRKRFEKIGAFRVSPGAVELLDRGFRLCMAEESPASYDLRRQP